MPDISHALHSLLNGMLWDQTHTEHNNLRADLRNLVNGPLRKMEVELDEYRRRYGPLDAPLVLDGSAVVIAFPRRAARLEAVQ